MNWLLQLPAISSNDNNFSLWGSGEWWMLLAAQSMAVGTVMVRWVSKYSDPVMATGWVRNLFQLDIFFEAANILIHYCLVLLKSQLTIVEIHVTMATQLHR